MSDASTTQSVECPICGDEFDPTVAGGWCTNTECGEWQYTEATESEQADDGDDVLAGSEAAGDDPGATEGDGVDAIAESTDGEPLDDESAEPTAETGEGAVDSVTGDTPIDSESDGDATAEPAGEPDAVEAESEDAVETDDGDAVTAESGDGLAAADEAEPTDDAVETSDDGDEVTAESGDGLAVADEAEPTDDAVETSDDGADADEPTQETVPDDADAATSDTIDCPDCGVELDADANFCMECGSDVSDVSPGGPLTACPSCGADVSPDDNFCVDCGEDLAAHRDGTADDDATDALDALGSDDDPVPESLVLVVEEREIDVDDGEKVGREVRAALMDAGRPEEEAVRIHREHVRFIRETDSFYLLDLGDNPTRLNGRTLTKGDREAVSPGDELELSGVATVEIRAP